MLKFGTKNVLFWYFWTGIWKNCYHIWNQHSQICLTANFTKKQKCPNLKPKMPNFGNSGLEFEKNFWYFWPKIPYLGILGVKFWKYYWYIWNQHPKKVMVDNYLAEHCCSNQNVSKMRKKITNDLFSCYVKTASTLLVIWTLSCLVRRLNIYMFVTGLF